MCYIKKTISVKIIVICVINSHVIKKVLCTGFVFIRWFVSKAFHSLIRILTHTTRENSPPRRLTLYDVNYIYRLNFSDLFFVLSRARVTNRAWLLYGRCPASGKTSLWQVKNFIYERSIYFYSLRITITYPSTIKFGYSPVVVRVVPWIINVGT